VISNKSKILVLIPDGVSLRNFAYTNFCELAKKNELEVVFWNLTPFDLETFGFRQIQLKHARLHWLTTVFKNARKRIEIKGFAKQDKDSVYYKYLFPQSYKGIKNIMRSLLTNIVTYIFSSESGLRFIRNIIHRLEQQTDYYKSCKVVLEEHKPDLVYCTSQRTVLAVAPILAAQNMDIPTVSFVFSWDNLPKATLDVTADFYHVWSQHMKDELLHYYPFIHKSQVQITGTPQFEIHYDKSNFLDRDEFCATYDLDIKKTYICFSGDDVTTSPKDELYLRDVAEAMRQLNNDRHDLGLIFRRCPVDFSNRYDAVIETYQDVIFPIHPEWKKIGGVWDTIMPLPEDLILLASLAEHTEAVINLGSSMVFDFAAHQKPCMYMNYNYLNVNNKPEKGVYVYDYVHFRSRPNNDVVLWLNHPDEIRENLKDLLKTNDNIIGNANQWFKTINQLPPQLASSRILDNIVDIIAKTKPQKL